MKKPISKKYIGDAVYFITVTVLFVSFSAFVALHGRQSITVEKSDTEAVSEISRVTAHSDSGTPASAEEIPLITETRTLCEYCGELAVFDCFGEILYTKSCDLMLFSPEDRKKLSDGIVFDSERELSEFLESFGS